MTAHATVVIIGAGIVGASIAWNLAKRGMTDVIILDKQASLVQSSSGHTAGGFRHQFSHPDNVRFSLYSSERLKHFQDEMGVDAGFQQVGYFFLIAENETWQRFQQYAQIQRDLGLPVELMSPDEARHFMPQLHSDDLVGATLCRQDGFFNPLAVWRCYLDQAQARGVRLMLGHEAVGFERQNDRILKVETWDGTITCDTVVNATGAWAGQVAALAGTTLPVQPFRRHVYVSQSTDALPPTLPFMVDIDTGFYMRRAGDRLYMGRANSVEPSNFSTDIDWEWSNAVLDVGRHRIPALKTVQLDAQASWAGLYEVTPDSNPILGRHPQISNYIDASGFSGHGVMHSPATGCVIAEEILDGVAHTINIDAFRITRLGAGQASLEQNVI